MSEWGPGEWVPKTAKRTVMHFDVNSGLPKPNSEKQYHQILFCLFFALFKPNPRGRRPREGGPTNVAVDPVD